MQEATRRVQWRYAGAFFLQSKTDRPLGEQLRIFTLLMHAFRATCHNELKRKHFVLTLKCIVKYVIFLSCYDIMKSNWFTQKLWNSRVIIHLLHMTMKVWAVILGLYTKSWYKYASVIRVLPHYIKWMLGLYIPWGNKSIFLWSVLWIFLFWLFCHFWYSNFTLLSYSYTAFTLLSYSKLHINAFMHLIVDCFNLYSQSVDVKAAVT